MGDPDSGAGYTQESPHKRKEKVIVVSDGLTTFQARSKQKHRNDNSKVNTQTSEDGEEKVITCSAFI